MKKIFLISTLVLFNFLNATETNNIHLADKYILELHSSAFIPKNIASDFSVSLDKNESLPLQQTFLTSDESNEYLHGLYLKTNTAYDLQNNDSAYDVRIEYDIFDQGYYEHKKKQQRLESEQKINYYKTLKSIEWLSYEQAIQKLQNYENIIRVESLLLQLKIAEANYNYAKQLLDKGLITKIQLSTYTFAVQKIQDDLVLMRHKRLVKIPHNLYTLLNSIEHVELLPTATLLQQFDENNVDIKLAKSLQEKPNPNETWRDNLRVNVYAGSRKMYLAQNQTLVGVEAKIPLSSFNDNQEVNHAYNLVLSRQVTLQRNKLREELRNSIAQFLYLQHKIKTSQYQLQKIQQHIKESYLVVNSDAAIYLNESIKQHKGLQEQYSKLYLATQLQRLNAYKELITIRSLTHTKDLSKLFSDTTP